MRRVSEKEWRELVEETKRLYVEENVKMEAESDVLGRQYQKSFGTLMEMTRTLIMIFKLTPQEMEELKKEAERKVKAYRQASK